MLSLGMLIEAPAEPGLNVLKEIVFMAHHLGLTGGGALSPPPPHGAKSICLALPCCDSLTSSIRIARTQRSASNLHVLPLNLALPQSG
jgi:hypothetical protein